MEINSQDNPAEWTDHSFGKKPIDPEEAMKNYTIIRGTES